ncbi:MAG: septum formation initiator family protein [Actinomycetes bacterium]
MATPKESLFSRNEGRGISGRSLAVGTVLLVLAITLAPPLQRYFAQRAQINALQSQLAENTKSLQAAAKELALWNDPAYVAQQARTRLHFVYPGERQYIILGLPKSTTVAQTPAAPVSEQIPLGLPWYSRVISSITSTNLGTP